MTIARWLRPTLVAFTALLVVGQPAAGQMERPDLGLPWASAEDVGMSEERLARIGPVMQRYIDDRLVPGTITLIARQGQIVHFETRGDMDAERGIRMRPDALFRLASMTKPIASVALMMLWEEGHFQLNDPVAEYLPEFGQVMVSTTADASGETGTLVEPKVQMTIRHLLTHTAGLANSYIGNTAFYAQSTAAASQGDLASYVRGLAALPLNYHPGEEWQYSHATTVVGRLVEVFSGIPLDQFFTDRIFEPLDMPDTHFFLEEHHATRLTAQYTPGPDEKIVLQDPGTIESRWISGLQTFFSGSGGLVSTARDYVRFQQTILNGGELDGHRILSPVTVSLMLENHTGDLVPWLTGPGFGFGLGYAVVTDRGTAGTPQSEGSGFWGGAYATSFWVDREAELIGIFMTQVRPYQHINVRQGFRTLTYQAIVR